MGYDWRRGKSTYWTSIWLLVGHLFGTSVIFLNTKVVSPVVEGIKESFRLSAGLVLAVGTAVEAVGSVMSSFARHNLSLRDSARLGTKQHEHDGKRQSDV